MLDEHGPRDARLVGEHDRRRGRVRAHGRGRDALAVLRAAARPEPPLRLRPGAGDQAALLTLWNSAKFLADYGAIEQFRPVYADLERGGPDGELQPLDRWLVERTAQLVAEAEAGYERWLTVDVTRAFDAFVDDVSNWYIRRSRRRFWDGDETALRTLWFALVQGLRVISPVMPFLAEHLWQALVARRRRRRARAPSSSPAGPRRARPTPRYLAEVAELRSVVDARAPGARRRRPEAAPAAPPHRRRGRAARRRRMPPRSPRSCA